MWKLVRSINYPPTLHVLVGLAKMCASLENKNFSSFIFKNILIRVRNDENLGALGVNFEVIFGLIFRAILCQICS